MGGGKQRLSKLAKRRAFFHDYGGKHTSWELRSPFVKQEGAKAPKRGGKKVRHSGGERKETPLRGVEDDSSGRLSKIWLVPKGSFT